MTRYRIRAASPIEGQTVVSLIKKAAREVGRDSLRVRKTPKSPIGRPVPGRFRQFQLLQKRVLLRLTKIAIMKAMGEMETTKRQKQLVWEAQKRFVKDRKNENAGFEFIRTVQSVLGKTKTTEFTQRFERIIKDARTTMGEELLKY